MNNRRESLQMLAAGIAAHAARAGAAQAPSFGIGKSILISLRPKARA